MVLMERACGGREGKGDRCAGKRRGTANHKELQYAWRVVVGGWATQVDGEVGAETFGALLSSHRVATPRPQAQPCVACPGHPVHPIFPLPHQNPFLRPLVLCDGHVARRCRLRASPYIQESKKPPQAPQKHPHWPPKTRTRNNTFVASRAFLILRRSYVLCAQRFVVLRGAATVQGPAKATAASLWLDSTP